MTARKFPNRESSAASASRLRALLLSAGPSGLTVDQVLSRLDISRRTFNYRRELFEATAGMMRVGRHCFHKYFEAISRPRYEKERSKP